jgi:hypothetical protein
MDPMVSYSTTLSDNTECLVHLKGSDHYLSKRGRTKKERFGEAQTALICGDLPLPVPTAGGWPLPTPKVLQSYSKCCKVTPKVLPSSSQKRLRTKGLGTAVTSAKLSSKGGTINLRSGDRIALRRTGMVPRSLLIETVWYGQEDLFNLQYGDGEQSPNRRSRGLYTAYVRGTIA